MPKEAPSLTFMGRAFGLAESDVGVMHVKTYGLHVDTLQRVGTERKAVSGYLTRVSFVTGCRR